ncbi:MAG: chorismate synthase [Flavobacteriales bacterium]|nr:chorismate synthase [Flavobacteriales bacterium]
MAGNSFGTIFKLTTFGESHGIALGGIIDGCPAGIELDFDFIQEELNRRKPGQSRITTQRKENDEVEFLSGIFEGKTTGTPIGFIIKNTNEKSKDYNHIKDSFRPSHADFTYEAKYGHRDYRGGGRSSARETACRVVGGAIAKQILIQKGISVQAYVSQVGPLKLKSHYSDLNLKVTYSNSVRCPDEKMADEMFEYIDQIRKDGDTIGGTTTCVIKGCPIGLGNPVFDRLEADLAKAMLSINASKGFEIGSGFSGTLLKGSEHNDEFYVENNIVKTKTNNSGGIQGGISNGEDIYFNVAFKPVATIMKTQTSIDKNYNEVTIDGKGRHDPCVLPRAVAIVESMAALVILDHLLLNQSSKI